MPVIAKTFASLPSICNGTVFDGIVPLVTLPMKPCDGAPFGFGCLAGSTQA